MTDVALFRPVSTMLKAWLKVDNTYACYCSTVFQTCTLYVWRSYNRIGMSILYHHQCMRFFSVYKLPNKTQKKLATNCVKYCFSNRSNTRRRRSSVSRPDLFTFQFITKRWTAADRGRSHLLAPFPGK